MGKKIKNDDHFEICGIEIKGREREKGLDFGGHAAVNTRELKRNREDRNKNGLDI